MKRWTRKLLAGLLSFGMLLQVASPLSALAADGVGADTAELIVILKQGDTGKEITAYVGQDTTSIDLGGNYKPTVAYGVDGYIITGPMGMYHSASGNGQGYSDEVTIKGVNGHTPSLKQDGQVNGDLTVENVDSFTKIGSVNGTEKINCTGDVELETESNVSYGLNVETQGSVTVTATGKADTLAGNTEINCDGPVNIKNTSTGLIICVGNLVVNTSSDVTISGNCESLTKYSSVADIKAKSLTMQNDDGSIGNVKFTRTDTTSAYRVAVGESESSNTQTALDGKTYSETVNAKYLNIQSGTPEDTDPDDQVTNYGITVAMNNDEAVKVTNKNCGNILGTEYTDGKLVYDPKANTLTGTGSFGALEITANGATVNLSNAVGATTPVVGGALTITGAHDVIVTAAKDTAAVGGKLTIKSSTGNVTVTGNRDNQNLYNGFGTIIDGDTDIDCSGDILLKNEGTGDVIGDSHVEFIVRNAHDVTVSSKCDNYTFSVYGNADITCTGNVLIANENAAAITGYLKVNGAKNVKVTGSDTHSINGDATIKCSGIVVLENKGTGSAVGGTLTYEPVSPAKAYVVKAGTDAANAESEEPYTNADGEIYSETIEKQYISITPDYVPTDDTAVATDSASDAGGAVAAVLVGSAAVWGGYEIATRVILHNILPEGAAIPANRGQLALLVWNNAGRPAPVNEPAFVDMDDADKAKAAQWCVEQGIMEAKTAETFKPEGWMPKFKVIEVWNKAFPKQ